MFEHRGGGRSHASPTMGGAEAVGPVRPRSPAEQAEDQAARTRALVERFGVDVQQLSSVESRPQWRIERGNLETRVGELQKRLAADESSAASSDKARAELQAATKQLQEVTAELHAAKEPRPQKPVSREIEIEQAVAAKAMHADDVLAWAAQLGAGERTRIQARLRDVANGGPTEDRDHFAVALANFIASAGMRDQFQRVLSDPKHHFAADRYEQARRDRHDPSRNGDAATDETKTSDVDDSRDGGSPDDILRKIVESAELDDDALSGLSVSDKKRLLQRLKGYRPGNGDELAARFTRLDRPVQLRVTNVLEAKQTPTHRSVAKAHTAIDVASNKPHPVKQPTTAGDLAGNFEVDADGLSARVRSAWLHEKPIEHWHELLLEMVATIKQTESVPRANAESWPSQELLERFSRRLASGFPTKSEIIHFRLDAIALAMIGLPEGSEPYVERIGNDLMVVIPGVGSTGHGEAVPVGGQANSGELAHVVAALEAFTGLTIANRNDLALSARGANTTTAVMRLHDAELAKIFGEHAWSEWKNHKAEVAQLPGGPSETTTTSAEHATPNVDTSHGSGASLSAEERAKITCWFTENGLPAPRALTRAVFSLVIELEHDTALAGSVRQYLTRGNGHNKALDEQSLRAAIERARVELDRARLGFAETPAGGAQELDPLDSASVPMRLTESQLIVPGRPAEFSVEVDWGPYIGGIHDYQFAHREWHTVVEWAFERVDVQGPAKQPGAPISAPRRARTEHGRGPIHLSHTFQLGPHEERGLWTVHAFVHSSRFAPRHLTADVEVKTEQARMHDLRQEAFGAMEPADATTAKHQFDIGGLNDALTNATRIGTTATSHPYDPHTSGTITHGELPSDFAATTPEKRAEARQQEIERTKKLIEYLSRLGDVRYKDALEAATRRLEHLEQGDKALARDAAAGWQPFELRGTYLGHRPEVRSGPLDLYGHVRREQMLAAGAGAGVERVFVQLRDHSQRLGPELMTHSGDGASFEQALEQAFVKLCKEYPDGKLSIMAEVMDTSGAKATPTRRAVGFELATTTPWKAVKAAYYAPNVQRVVNAAAIALMIFQPELAPLMLSLLTVSNTVRNVDELVHAYENKTLGAERLGITLAQIGLDLMPFMRGARLLQTVPRLVAFEVANYAGMSVVMALQTHEAVLQIQEGDIAALAETYRGVVDLLDKNPSDPGLAQAMRDVDARAQKIRDRSTAVWKSALAENAAFMVGTHVLSGVQRQLVHDTPAPVHDADARTPHDDPPHPSSTDGHASTHEQASHRTDLDAAHGSTSSTEGSLVAEAAANKRLRQDGPNFRANADELYHVQSAWPGRGKGDTVTPIHYDPDTNTAYFDVHRSGERVRVTASVAPAIKTPAELTSSANRIIGSATDAGTGHQVLRDLNDGRLSALSAIGVDVPTGTMVKVGTEFGLGETSDGRFVVVLGEKAAVDWTYLPGVKPKAHTHPSTSGNDFGRLTGSERVALSRIVENTPDPLIARELVMPSPADVAVMVHLGVEDHRVITPFVVHDGYVTKPKADDVSPRLEWVIERPHEVGRTAKGDTVYEATLVGEVAGKLVVQTKVWSIAPADTASGNEGSHWMSPPPMTQTSTAPLAISTRTSAGGPKLTDPATRLINGPDSISAAELTAIESKHGKDTVVWASDSLDGVRTKRLLDALEPVSIVGMRDVPAAEALHNLDIFGSDNIKKAVPPLTGRQLQVEREQLGSRAARGVVEGKLQKNKVSAVDEHANNLISATGMPMTPLQNASVIADTNVLMGIKGLMAGSPWANLSDYEKNGINWLRRHATPALPALNTDPPARDAASIIGDGHDLRAANNTLGENSPMAGLEARGFELTVSRDSKQYNLVLDELARGPDAVGQNKGDGDRAIVADAMFAAGPGVPRLMTADKAMINTLFRRYCPAAAGFQQHGQQLHKAVAAAHPNGFKAEIPDGLGGTRTILVIAMVN